MPIEWGYDTLQNWIGTSVEKGASRKPIALGTFFARWKALPTDRSWFDGKGTEDRDQPLVPGPGVPKNPREPAGRQLSREYLAIDPWHYLGMTPMIKHISAITFAVRDMARSLEFYRKLGFEQLCGGDLASFRSLRTGDAFVNLALVPNYEGRWWGRAIFRVEDVDAYYQALVKEGLTPQLPRDADWGERFFHIADPDGHELSFAELVEEKTA